MKFKSHLIVSALASAALLSACSSPQTSPEEPVETTVSFVKSYDHWAQSGYADPIPDALLDLASTEMRDVLEEDQDWYLTGQVQQHGDVEITGTELIESNNDHAVVRVTLDASNVSVTAEGQETWVDYSKPIVSEFTLEKSKAWRVVSAASAK
ncbi:hypothetical protein [Plantibacter flavus]|uniref:hypothetical protein n=1 Tax=Plantibacter flavus TaxID=150123 RepID=UPI0012947534|nr:hypothetical protein [Plantibacter flavus]